MKLLTIMLRGAVLSALIAVAGAAAAQTTVVLDDFSSGVVAKKQTGGNGDFTTWYDCLNKASGSPGASISPTPGAMQISEDGINGIYRIFRSVVPSTGSWHVNVKVSVVETSPSLNAIQLFQVGAIVNGTHRSAGNSKLATPAYIAQTPSWFLTPGDDTGKGVRIVRTPDFVANSGDDILVALGTDLTSGNFNLNSVGAWSPSYVLIDDIVLEQQGLPVSVSGWTLE